MTLQSRMVRSPVSAQDAAKAWKLLATRAAGAQPRGDAAAADHTASGAARTTTTAVPGGAASPVHRAGVNTDGACLEGSERIAIVPMNRDRIAINEEFARRCIAASNEAAGQEANWRERGVLLIDAVFYRYRPYERDPPRYSEHWQAVWRRLVAETDLGNKYAPVLRVIFGKRYMLTQNTNVSHGIANGMWAEVRDVILKEGREPRWDATEGAFRVDADAVKYLIIKYPDRTWSKRKLHSKLPPGHFILTPDTPETAASGSKIFSFDLCGNTKKFRITQLSMIQAHAVTGHKAQGQSLPSIVLTRLHHTGVMGQLVWHLRSLGWFYTGASRTMTREGLQLETDELPLAHIQAPRHEILHEMERLQVLHERTHARVHSQADP